LETWQKAALACGLGFAGATAACWAYLNSCVNRVDAELVRLETDVSVVMPTLNEEEYVGRALESLKSQNIVRARPDRFEFVVVDSHSRDRTVEIAGSYADRILLAPRGILNARTVATRQSRGDIVVSVNADTFYPPNFLNLLLRPFADPEVVAVTGLRVHEGFSPLTMWCHLARPRMFGSNSAFRKWAFDAVGGFNLGVDQSVSEELVWAEEVDFPERLAGVGKYVFEPRAVAFTSPRRLLGQLLPNGTSFV